MTQVVHLLTKKVSASNIFNYIPTWLGLAQTSQTITADGSSATAINVTTAVTEINATSATHSGALADGTDGQIKMIVNTSTSGTNAVTITPASRGGYSSITLDKEGESVTLMFKNSKWYVIAEGNGATINA